MKAVYCKTAAEFRRWLAAHHASERELIVGFYRKASWAPGISYKEAVDEALCFGWIDGIKRKVDEARYTHRFTPRKKDSVWSLVNATRVKELIALKRMATPGLEAWQRLMTFFVMEAKQQETRLRRLDRLITASAAGQRIQ